MPHAPGTNLLITCHPSPASLCGAIASLVAETLAARGTPAVITDLNQVDFSPVLSRQELADYFSAPVPGDVAGLAADLQAAEQLIFVVPVWTYGLPALLKGYFDRVWRPGVSFVLDDGQVRPLLHGIGHLTVVATHGASEAEVDRTGDGTRLFFATSLPSILPALRTNTRFDIYGLDAPDRSAIATGIERIRQHFA